MEDRRVERSTVQTVYVDLTDGLDNLKRRNVRETIIPIRLILTYRREGDGPWACRELQVCGPRRLKNGSEGEVRTEALWGLRGDPEFPGWVTERIERYRPLA